MTGAVSTRLPVAAYLGHLDRDAAALRAAFLRGPDDDVPTCPGWTRRDLLDHVAAVYAHKVVALTTGQQPAQGTWSRPSEFELIDWFDHSLRRLRELLASLDPVAPVWSWWPAEQTVGFWVRRMAQETLVHRYDAQRADEPAPAVDAQLARDGLDEILGWLTWDWSDLPLDSAVGQRVAVVSDPIDEHSDADASSHAHATVWTITLQRDACQVDGPVEVDVDHVSTVVAATDLVLAGSADQLLMFLWGRVPSLSRVLGDEATLSVLRARLAAVVD